MQQTVCYHAWWSFYRVNATSQGRFQTYRSDTVIVFTKFKVKSDLQWFLFFPSAFSRSLMFLSKGAHAFVFFSYYFGGGNWNFYDPEIEICKINYCKNKVKLNNKDNSKNNINGIRKLFNLSISFPFSLQFKNFLQLAFTYSNSTIKTQEQGVQCLKIANTGNWKDTRKM